MRKAGWNWLFNSRKWHFFKEDGRSLCGKWMTLGTNADAEDYKESKDNCTACVRKYHENQGIVARAGHPDPVDHSGASGPA